MNKKPYHIEKFPTDRMIRLYAEDAYHKATLEHDAFTFRWNFDTFVEYNVDPRYDYDAAVVDLDITLWRIASLRFDFDTVFESEGNDDGELAPFGWMPKEAL